MITFILIVLGAAVASFILGWIWYSRPVFGNIWMKESGVIPTEEDRKKMGQTLGTGFLADVVKAFFLLFLSANVGGGGHPFLVGFVVWIGFLLPLLLTSKLYEKRSWTLFMINGGYQLASLLVMGLVFYFV
jgi:hypothetical protein